MAQKLLDGYMRAVILYDVNGDQIATIPVSLPADPLGANADAIVAAGAAGSISAKLRRATQGLEDLKSLIVLAAGTNAIGKLAANSGVDIGDVDVLSLPALPAGTNNIGDVDALVADGADVAEGATADAAATAGGTGTLSAKLRRATQGLEDLKSLIVLAAGANAIGKLAANSGVDIGDVDVLSLPALPAGTNNIGDVDALIADGADVTLGALADVVVAAGAAGSISAKLRRATQGLEDLKTLIVLGAGTNAIGKLAANTGVDIGDVDVLSLPALPAGTNNIGDVDVLTLPALPAGTNNIGDVDVLTLPALPAGTNNIGDVDVLTLPALPAGTNNIGDVDALIADGADVALGAVADLIVAAGAAGSVSAKLRRISQGLEDLKTLVVLGAGTNAIGKLAANTGVDIGDVDVLSLPALPAGTNNIGDVDVLTLPALPAGTNNIGDVDVLTIAAGDNNIGNVDIVTQPALARTVDAVAVAQQTDALMNGLTALTPKFAIIDAALSGDNTLVAAVVSKKIRVLALFMVASAAVTARFESGAAGTALTGQMQLAANGGFVLPYNPLGWFESASGVLLNLELSGAISVDGSLTYVEV